MNPEKIWVALVILLVLLVGANLLMFGIARGARDQKIDIEKGLNDLANPWKKEDDSLRELKERVRDLKSKRDKDASS